MIETPRLILRPFRDDDADDWAALNADTRVSDWLAGPISRAAADAARERINAHIAQHGYGFWAAERKAHRRLVGMIGLRWCDDTFAEPAVEAAWRLSPDTWGQGLASEGAAAALDWGFANLKVPEIIAMTADSNLRSQAVMTRLGMRRDPQRDFDHPRLSAEHPLRRHVVFVKPRP